MFKIALCGVVTALLATHLRAVKEEYRLFVILAAGLVFTFWILDKMTWFVDSLKQIQEYTSIDPIYMNCILRMIGITCICEFSANLCRDSGHETLAEQISMLARLVILSFSVPIVLAILESIHGML
ncbi:MAG: stage III sporulation protein AD [Lachnospiraceae bacterium]|nr:stage III sporulation protein AD [Lachnospiraceae bacterium]